MFISADAENGQDGRRQRDVTCAALAARAGSVAYGAHSLTLYPSHVRRLFRMFWHSLLHRFVGIKVWRARIAREPLLSRRVALRARALAACIARA